MGKYLDNIAPWEQYPKNLKFDEVMNPLKVVIEFFMCAFPKEQRSILKEWRHYVLSDKYYKDHCGPGNILFLHDTNVHLVEALHLLLLKNNIQRPRLEKVTESQIEQEKKEWIYFPNNLSPKELADPYLVLKKCFKKISPQDYRDHLHEWLSASLHNYSIDESVSAGEIMTVYDNMRKLHSAAWLIHQRETDHPLIHKPQNIGGEKKEYKTLPATVDADDSKPLKDIVPQPTEKERAIIEKIKNLIVERIPGVSLIYLIGVNTKPAIYYLVVLINDDQKVVENEVVNKIEDNCRFLGTVLAIVHKMSTANEGLKKDKRFWQNVLYKGINLYRNPEVGLLTVQSVDDNTWLQKAENDWNKWGKQGQEFMKGAVRYMEDDNSTLALFSLHQAAESSLIGIIRAILGYRITVHNLPRMIKMTLLFTHEIKKTLELTTMEGTQHFNLLQTGYSDTRYKADFKPDEQLIKSVKVKVEALLNKTEEVYHKFIESKTAR